MPARQPPLGLHVYFRAPSRKDLSIRIGVKVTAKAPKSEIAGWADGTLRIRVTAVPERGKANEEVLRIIASAIDLPGRNVRLASGRRGRTKVVEVLGLAQADFDARMQNHLKRHGYP